MQVYGDATASYTSMLMIFNFVLHERSCLGSGLCKTLVYDQGFQDQVYQPRKDSLFGNDKVLNDLDSKATAA